MNATAQSLVISKEVISQRKILTTVLIGSILETFDYGLYAYFAPILAKQFFPQLNQTAALLATFTIFAAGFIARPLGALVFGFFGDKYGRKSMLLASILLMAIPTTLIGLLPTYATLGIYASLLLAFCRLLQGFAVGAEFVGAMIYMIECAPPAKKKYYGSLVIAVSYLALLFIAICSMILHKWQGPQLLQTWGWRLPFILSFFLCLIGLYIRSHLDETPSFLMLQEKATTHNPVATLMFKMPTTILLGIGAVVLHALGFYLLFVYMNTYLLTYYHIDAATISLSNMINLMFTAFLIASIGRYSEKFSKTKVMMLGCCGILIVSLPLYSLLQYAHFFLLSIMQMILIFLYCLTSAMVPAFLAEIFPTHLRFTGMALSYNLAVVLFGGSIPFLLTYLIHKTHNLSMPAYFLMIASAITLVSVMLCARNK